MSAMRGILLCFLLLSAISVSAQNKCWVFLADKDGVRFDPQEYFHPNAIERRVQLGLPLDHYTDRPVREDYLQTVGTLCDSVKMHSRWFNAVVCFATPQQILELEALPFVKEVVQEKMSVQLAGVPDTTYTFREVSFADAKLLRGQIERFHPEAFDEGSFDGTGIRVAIFDAGFPNVDKSPAFKHIRDDNRIISTYDFVKKKDYVYDFNSHGTNTMSCVGGMLNGERYGLATGAEFLLARTETWTEFFGEEENWLAAAEWADKNGAHIINSSLGYTYHRYFNNQMDGKTSFVTRAANMAAGKGILVVNSAGNEGTDEWHTIGAPADADSVLSIGGINPWSGYHTSFSSYGPTSDGRMKPNVTAFGHVLAEGKSGPNETQGTSFSGPLVAGFAACAWQADKSLTNMQLFKALEASGDLYPYYDYAHGYGVPQAAKFLKVEPEQEPTFELGNAGSVLTVKFKEKIETNFGKSSPTMKPPSLPQGEKKVFTDVAPVLFYHLEAPDGQLQEYYVVSVYKQEITLVDAEKYPGFILRVFYKGYAFEKKLN